MKAPSPDGTDADGSCYVVDAGDSTTPIKIYVTSTLTAFDQFKVYDNVIITNAPTLSGAYILTLVETFAALGDGAVLTTSQISSSTYTIEGA